MQLKVVEKPGFDSSVFPFKTVFSLVPLIERFWEKAAGQGDTINRVSTLASFARQLKERLTKVPELLQPITDPSVIEKHRDLVDALMSVVFPAATSQYDMYAAVRPFDFHSFYETLPMKQLPLFEDENLRKKGGRKFEGFNDGVNLFAYIAVMKVAYDVDIHFEYPFIYNWKDDNGLDRYHRIRMYPHFLEIKVNGEIPPLTDEKKNKLLNNLLDENIWLEIINPEQFEFHGFLLLNAIDVTPQEVISSLKYDLIDKDSIISIEKFNKLQHKLRSLLKKPELRLGLMALGDKHSLDLHDHVKLVKSFVLSQSCIDSCTSCAGTVYDKLMDTKELIFIRDLKKYTGCTPVELGIAEQGIRNLVLAPLEYNDELIGIMELGSPHEGDLNEIN